MTGMPPPMTAIDVCEVVKTYGGRRVVDGISLSVQPGETYGLLGPNGAGKTTFTEMLEGLRRPDQGSIRILGMDVSVAARACRQRIGVQLQSTALFRSLTVRETLDLFSRLFDVALPVEDVLATMRLTAQANRRLTQVSGGQRQRLAVGLAFLNDPDIVFLDEPTVGLDPEARQDCWSMIDEFRARGKTVFLTTHYLEESERLCDRVGLMHEGRIVATGRPVDLVRAHFTGTTITVRTSLSETALRNLPAVQSAVRKGESVTIASTSAPETLTALFALARNHPAPLEDLTVSSASLEDVLLKLTRRSPIAVRAGYFDLRAV